MTTDTIEKGLESQLADHSGDELDVVRCATVLSEEGEEVAKGALGVTSEEADA